MRGRAPKILVAFGTFKGTLTSTVACNLFAERLQKQLPGADIDTCPLSDGGEGTLEVIKPRCPTLKEIELPATDPLGRNITAQCYMDVARKIAIIQSSDIVGHSLLSRLEQNPMSVTSFGMASVISQLFDKGFRTIAITMGDSVIMDMGIGMLQGLGVKFFDPHGGEIDARLHNADRIAAFDDSALDTLRERVRFVCLVDTSDFLLGENGQVSLYGVQKGLSASEMDIVENVYLSLSDLILSARGARLRHRPLTSGSGGLSAALYAFLDARLYNTLPFLNKLFGWSRLVADYDVVVTGEGALDAQTKFGKVPHFVAEHSRGSLVGVFGSWTEAGFADLQRVHSHIYMYSLEDIDSIGWSARDSFLRIAERIGRDISVGRIKATSVTERGI